MAIGSPSSASLLGEAKSPLAIVIGRALVNTVLRRRDVTRTVTITFASALVARREAYFDLLARYREGDAEPIVAAFVHAATLAAHESGVTANRMAAFPDQWREALGAVRGGSATARLLKVLPRVPVVTVKDAENLIGAGTSALYRAVDRLVEVEVLRPLTHRKRNQVLGGRRHARRAG